MSPSLRQPGYQRIATDPRLCVPASPRVCPDPRGVPAWLTYLQGRCQTTTLSSSIFAQQRRDLCSTDGVRASRNRAALPLECMGTNDVEHYVSVWSMSRFAWS